MSKRLLSSAETETHHLGVYSDNEWDEFVAVVRCKANKAIVSSYHTNDRGDAVSTGNICLKACTDQNITTVVSY